MRGATATFVLFTLLACQGPSIAKDATPVLTEVQRLTAELKAERFRRTQVQLQAAQQEAQRAQTELEAYLKSLTRPGWSLNLQTWEYTPEPPAVGKK